MSKKDKILIVLILLVLVIFSFFIYLIYQEKQKKGSISNHISLSNNLEKEIKERPEDLKGKIYLTLKEKKSEKQGIYYFDLDRNELKEIYTANGECEIIGGKLNSDGTKVAYTSNCEQENGNYQIFIYDLNQNSSRQLTDIPGKIKKETAWSDDNSEIVFINSNSEKEVLGDWSIYKTDLEGNEEFIASNSWNPFFLKNKNKIIAFREAGFHLYDTEINQGKKLLDFDLINQFDFSNKSNNLLFSLKNSSGKNKIEKYKIENWDEFKITRINEVDIPGNSTVSWLNFDSKNEKYVVGKKNELGEALTVYDLLNKQEYLIKDFSENYNLIQIDDWR